MSEAVVGAIAGPVLGSVLGSIMAPSAPEAPQLPPPPQPAQLPAAPALPVLEAVKDPNAALDLEATKLRDTKRRAAAQQQGVTLLNQSSDAGVGGGKTLLGS